jgi:transaldolase
MTVIKQNPLFFFDTGDLDAIERTWEKLSKNTPSSAIAGITTNPNALAKIDCKSLKELELLTYRLTRFLTQVREDKVGAVHVQLPVTFASEKEHLDWATYLLGLGDGRSHVAMKIPPFKHVLDRVRDHGLNQVVQINVTGVSDAATALRCFSYPEVTYVSIIPGRMEEVGIDAQTHLRFANQRNNAFTNKTAQYVIAGSMRTVDGLQRSIDAGTIPTIGQRVWDAMSDDDYANFASWWRGVETDAGEYSNDIPLIDERNVKLTTDFFSQMDTLGEPLYNAFVGR